MRTNPLPKDKETTEHLDIERWENEGGRSVLQYLGFVMNENAKFNCHAPVSFNGGISSTRGAKSVVNQH